MSANLTLEKPLDEEERIIFHSFTKHYFSFYVFHQVQKFFFFFNVLPLTGNMNKTKQCNVLSNRYLDLKRDVLDETVVLYYTSVFNILQGNKSWKHVNYLRKLKSWLCWFCRCVVEQFNIKIKDLPVVIVPRTLFYTCLGVRIILSFLLLKIMTWFGLTIRAEADSVARMIVDIGIFTVYYPNRFLS